MKIRLFEKRDIPIRVEWMNMPEIYSNMGFIPPITIEGTLKWFEKNQFIDNRVDVTYLDDNNEIIGFGGITGIDWRTRRGEVYTFINPAFHGKGYGIKANRLVIEFGFKVLMLNEIYSYANSNNKASIGIWEKLGFELQNVFKDEKLVNGSPIDRYYYALTRKKYLSNNFGLENIVIGNLDLKIVRDDLYPIPGGGVKARKSKYYEQYMITNKYNACVTTGGIQSNHNRAIALMCAKNNWACHIVFHGAKDRFEEEKGNALLVKKSGSNFEFVDADLISISMDKAISDFEKKGLNPLYIHGGGHDLPGGFALVEAVKDLKEKCDEIGYKPKYIFHASGTGSTQAGIAVGLDLVGWSDVKLVGISVARQKERGTKVIEEFANKLAAYYGLSKDYSGKINFISDYLCGGYEKFSSEMTIFLDEVMKKTGIMFDTTYSGKALWGMSEYCRKNNISNGVLFWHTGGLMNLMK